MSIPSRAEWIRWGFMEPERAAAAAQSIAEQAGTVAQMCAAIPDPDLGFSAYAALSEVCDVSQIDPHDPGWVRLMALLGGSAALGRWLRQRPGDREVFFESTDPWGRDAIREDILARIDKDTVEEGTDELRWAFRRHMMRIAARDLSSVDPGALLETTCEELTDLDDAVVEGAIVLARRSVPHHDLIRFGVVALGKTGAREVNYISDVDVIYLAEPRLIDGEPTCTAQKAVQIGTQMAARVTNICSAYTAAGTIWELDANLRPEGAAGPLVRTLAGMRSYYTTWAKNWEFQAMLKARAMAGDREVAQEFVDMVSPLVWTAAEHEGFVTEAQAMRARVVALIPESEATRDIKLSAGGLRDTEFSVQMLELVHGRSDERLRVPATLPGLNALVAYGYVGRADGPELDKAYRFQRLLEHRLQLYHMRRTHLMPTDDVALRRLARSVGLKEPAQVSAAWRASAKTVLKLHQKIYYSPLLEAVARIPTDEIRLTPQAAAVRLKALGYADPVAALRHIQALTQGMTRRAEILRQLLPALLGWFAAGLNPDAGLLGFRQMAEALGSSPFFLRALRDEGQMAQNLATVLSTSRYASALLQRSPTNVEILMGRRQLPSRESLVAELTDVVARYGGDAKAGEVIRATRRRELLRIAVGDVLGNLDVAEVGIRLSDLNGASIEAALASAKRQVEDPPEMTVIALGRWGGEEMAYSSDADLMVILADSADPDTVRKGAQILTTLRKMLKVPGPGPDLEIDLKLRPEGKDGPMVRTLSSYVSYYTKWSATWEAQALIRARHGAGSEDLSAEFLNFADSVRYPTGGLTLPQLTEIRRLKARMEAERIGRGIDPRDHVKLGPGGLSDVEWTVQCCQLNHGFEVPELRVTGTLAGLDAAVGAGLIGEEDAECLREAFLLASRIRNTITLVRNKPSDLLPANASDLGEVATVLGFDGGSHLSDEWHRIARRARGVTDRLFWGETE